MTAAEISADAAMPPGAVYVGRPGRGQRGEFGNPIVVGRACEVCLKYHPTPGSTLDCFRRRFEHRVLSDLAFRVAVLALRGRVLWCPGRCRAKGQPCHAEIIVEWLGSNFV